MEEWRFLEHLDELRIRLMRSMIGITIALGGCWNWRPVERSLAAHPPCGPTWMWGAGIHGRRLRAAMRLPAPARDLLPKDRTSQAIEATIESLG